MKWKGSIFVVAILGIASSFWAIKRGMKTPEEVPLIVEPAKKPFTRSVAAAGIVEALGENVAVGSPEAGIVQELYVSVGEKVAKGTPLFKLDTRQLEAELKVAEAKERVAQAERAQILDQLSRLNSVKDSRAVSVEEIRSKENSLAVAEASLAQMTVEKEKIITLIDRLTISSPIDGIVLQKNVRPGERVSTETAAIIVGNLARLQVRCDIDENNAVHFDPAMEAVAYLKNRPLYPIALEFIRTEPLVVPKTSLTGSSKEKVDTRVLQVIYSFDPPSDISLFVGQQVDIYIQRGG